MLLDLTGDDQVTIDDIVIEQLSPGIGFQILLGNDLGQLALPIDFDLGIPGLNLDLDANVTGTLGFELGLHFGVNLDHGFFIDTTDSFMQVFVDVGVPGLSAAGELGFLRIDANLLRDEARNLSKPSALVGDGHPVDSQFTIESSVGGSTANLDVRVVAKGADDTNDFEYDSTRRVLTLRTTATTTAQTIINMINSSPQLNALFTASLVDGSDGSGVVASEQRAVGVANSFAGRFTVDILDPGQTYDGLLTLSEILAVKSYKDVLAIDATAHASLDLELLASFGGSNAFPSIQTDLLIDWQYLLGEELQFPQVEFKAISLDVGQFFNRFAGQVLEEANNILEPVRPIIEFLSEPVPVVSDLAGGNLTMLDLLKLEGGKVEKAAKFIESVADFDRILRNIPDLGAGKLLNLGDLTYTPGVGFSARDSSADVALRFKELGPANENFNPDDFLKSAAELESAPDNKIKLGFPLLDPTNIMGLLSGRVINLFTLELPTLELNAGIKKYFPLPIFPAVGVELGGAVSARADFVFGFDTHGIQQFLQTGDCEDVFNGFFVWDHETAEYAILIQREDGAGGTTSLQADDVYTLDFVVHDHEFDTLPFEDLQNYDFTLRHVYSNPGTYNVSVTVWDDDGGRTTSPVSTITIADTTAPIVTAEPITPNLRNTSVQAVNIAFSKSITGFDLGDLTLTRDGGADLLAGSGATLSDNGNGLWTLGNLSEITNSEGNYLVRLNHESSGIADDLGLALNNTLRLLWKADFTAPVVTVEAAVAGETGSLIKALGDLTIGDASSPIGFATRGERNVGPHSVTLLDSNQAVSGSLTQIGQAETTPGNLFADNGLLVDFGHNVTGWGTLHTPNVPSKLLMHNGALLGNSSTELIELTGYIKGVGTLDNAHVTGTYSPGFSPAVLQHGNLKYGNSATTSLEIGGTTPGSSGHDQTNHDGAAVPAGTLRIELINGFEPTLGQSFTLMTATEGFEGVFDHVEFPSAPAGTGWHLVRTANALRLELVDLAEVLGVVVGDSQSSQRSNIDSVHVTFDGAVDIDTDAFAVTKRGVGGGAVNSAFTTTVDEHGNTVATVTFGGGFTRAGFNLVDGNYQLYIDPSKVRRAGTLVGLDGDGDGQVGGDFVFGDEAADKFYAMFGEANGDRAVGFVDFLRFRNTFGSSRDDSSYNQDLDFNVDDAVGFIDFLAFRSRFGQDLPFE